MPNKYCNLNPVSLFGEYTDPFADRRGTGPTRPETPVMAVEPCFDRQFDREKLYFSWLGHSSVFINMCGLNILVDPVFSLRASPVQFAGPLRFAGTEVNVSALPEIDLVLITHNHYDHLDRQTILALDGRVKRYIVPLDVGKNLLRFGVSDEKITELGWYDEEDVCGLKIIAAPSQHDSGRSPFTMNSSLWCAFLLKGEGHTVFISGDGGFADHFADIHAKYGDVDLAVMECGQYNCRWHTIHMFPEESVMAAKILKAKLAIPVHWGAYSLSDHPWDDPPKRFSRRAQECGVAYKVPALNELLVL